MENRTLPAPKPQPVVVAKTQDGHTRPRGVLQSPKRGRFSAPVDDDGGASLSLADIRYYADAWLEDGQIRMLARTTLAGRELLLSKFFWWVDQQAPPLPRIGTPEVRSFLAYVASAHDQPEGRWGNGHAVDHVRVRPATAHKYFTVLKAFFTFTVGEGGIHTSPMDALRPPIVRADQVNPFSSEQIQRLLTAARASRHGARDPALILFMLDTGARAAEVCDLRASDLSLQEGWGLIRNGKGGKARKCRLSPTTRKALLSYVRHLGRDDDEPVFLAEGGTGAGGGLTSGGLTHLIQRLGKVAGIEGARCSPHTFRHTFAIEFLRAGGKSFALMEMLGHTSLTMTKRYVAIADADIEAQHRAFSPVEAMVGTRSKRR